MEIWMIAGILFVLAAVLFGYSMIKKEEKDLAYIELEEFSLAVTKTVFELNGRVQQLEKELSIPSVEKERLSHITRLSKDNVITLFTKGESAETISSQLDLSLSAVQEVIDTYITEGL